MSVHPAQRSKLNDNQPDSGKWPMANSLFLLLACAEIWLAYLWYEQQLTASLLLSAHCLIVLSMGLIWQHATSTNQRVMPIGIIVLFFTGPFGAAGMLLLALVLGFKKPETKLLDEWYRRLSQSTRRNKENLLYRSIIAGRAPKSGQATRGSPSPSSITSFYTIMEYGTLEQKQKLLGIIALKYHPDFFPLLKVALHDSDPTVRAQAAAVNTKLYVHYKAQLAKANSLAVSDQHSSLASSRELLACVKSGFLTKGELATARTLLKQGEARNVIAPIP